MIQRIKIEAVEDRQLPRWVYAMMKSGEDPNAELEDTADTKKRMAAQIKATDFYKLRQARMKEMADQQNTSRYSGLEWKSKRSNKFSSDELDRILPTRRASYVASKMFFLTIVGSCVLVATVVTLFIGMAVCAEMKMNTNAPSIGPVLANAWTLFTSSPTDYVHRVLHSFNWVP